MPAPESGAHSREVPSRAALRLRAFCAALLIAVGVILAPVAVVVAWTKTEVTDTGRFVTTLSPLVDDPGIPGVPR
ncbi:hypothetical protein [Cryobacterium sp. GrIS_2_6]|uniref:hypothetical protein n=1 Tax=Cryobacterium sp. GrIS_2_6 TaxID=3162785 RepID=UPI002E04F814|nr:hypothetical protein [Cryobacterium psychrotolerans]